MNKYSITITTYKYRFETWLKPLLNQIKKFRPEVEILVAINGEHEQKFDQDYRKNILQFLADKENVYITMYPNFRGLSKLWNNLLINSSNHLVLSLNDDISITSDIFFNELESYMENGLTMFKINSSWSHILLDRRVVNEVGWFDERLLSIGEEDGDFEWRFGEISKGKTIPNLFLHGIINHVDHNNCLIGMKKANSKYSKFNYDFINNEKYTIDNSNGKNYGIMNKNVICKNITPKLHTVEQFYWNRKDQL
jgi:hypothetical protein